MKILIYGLNYAPELTGTGKYTAEMAESLIRNGHEVRVICAPPYYPEWQIASGYSAGRYRREDVRGVRVWRAPIYRFRNDPAAAHACCICFRLRCRRCRYCCATLGGAPTSS